MIKIKNPLNITTHDTDGLINLYRITKSSSYGDSLLKHEGYMRSASNMADDIGEIYRGLGFRLCLKKHIIQ